MRNRRVALSLVGALVFGAFALGDWIGSHQRMELEIVTADGYVGADQASFQVGDYTYGFSQSVMWTDAKGSRHEQGWPECLGTLHEVKGVRIGIAVVWAEQSGQAEVLWVDCRGR